MTSRRIVTFIGALALAGTAVAQVHAQVPGTGERGSTPPGSSRDGSSPSDGAIQGGSIAPGETGGMPDRRRGAPQSSERAIHRCNDLQGQLREQCLRQERDASSGGSRTPPGPAAPPPVREAPLPQNPR